MRASTRMDASVRARSCTLSTADGLLQLRHVKTMSGFAAASSREVAVVRIHDAHSYLHCFASVDWSAGEAAVLQRSLCGEYSQ